MTGNNDGEDEMGYPTAAQRQARRIQIPSTDYVVQHVWRNYAIAAQPNAGAEMKRVAEAVVCRSSATRERAGSNERKKKS